MEQMESMLRINTKTRQEVEEGEPVSPTGQYYSSKSLSVYVLAILEFAVPVDYLSTLQLVQNVFLTVNPTFSSVMYFSPDTGPCSRGNIHSRYTSHDVSDVYDNKGRRRWKKVEINIQDHFNVVPSFPESLPVDSYDDHFDEFLTKLSTKPLQENRPLWEIHIINYPTSKAAGHIIFKLHHALGDGYSLMGALLSCLQREDNPSLPITFPSTRSTKKANNSRAKSFISCIPRTLSFLYGATFDFGCTILKSACIEDDMTPIKSRDNDLAFHPIKISTTAFSMDRLKLIKTKLQVTINAVITGIVSLGVRLYMQEKGTRFSNSRSTIVVLLNTRNVSGYMSIKDMLKSDNKIWGNQFAFLHIELPELPFNKALDPLDFVSKAQKNVLRKKNSPAVYLTGQFLDFIRKLRGSEAAARYIKGACKRASFGITSLIGPVEQVAMAEHPMKGLYFMPIGVHQVHCMGALKGSRHVTKDLHKLLTIWYKSLVVSVMSYMGTMRIGLGVEKGYIDSQKLVSHIQNAFELIFKAATKRE